MNHTHCSGKSFEWTMTLIIVLTAILMMLPGKVTITGGSVKDVIGIEPIYILPFLVALGLGRLSTLWHNGRWPIWGPRCRGIGAILGAVVWGQIGVTLILRSLSTGEIPLGIAVYIGLFSGEMYSCLRAYDDTRPS